MNIQEIDNQIKELQEKKEKILAEQKGTEWFYVPEIDKEVEVNLHTEMNTARKIKIPNGCELLTLFEWLTIYNNYKDKFDFGDIPDEITKQPIKENEQKYPYWNVWFGGLDGRSLIGGSGVRGVRFCRKGEKLK